MEARGGGQKKSEREVDGQLKPVGSISLSLSLRLVCVWKHVCCNRTGIENLV